MKRAILIAVVLLICSSRTAFAFPYGVNLAWSDCGASGTASRAFACSNNAEAGTLVCSVIPPEDMLRVQGHVSTIDIQTATSSLNPWWDMSTTGCRSTALSCSMDFAANSSCADPWVGLATSRSTCTVFAIPSRERIRGIGSIAGTTPITADREWYVCKLVLSGVKTAGTESCAGCQDGACFVLIDVFLDQPDNYGIGDQHISIPIQSEYATWQTAGPVPLGCPGGTPTKKSTWGGIKAIYR